jgi:transcriptional regulator with PAS, ATPase and Fis domain
MILFTLLESSFGNLHVLLSVVASAFMLKSYLLAMLIRYKSTSKKLWYQQILLTITITGSMTANLAWIIQLIKTLIIPSLSSQIPFFFTCFAWICVPIQYQALSLSIETLTDSESSFSFRQKIVCTLSAFLSCIFALVTIVNLSRDCTNILRTLEMLMTLYNTFFLMIPSIFIVFKRLRSSVLPTILQKQGKILLYWFVMPQLLCDTIQTMPTFHYTACFFAFANTFGFTSLSTLLMTSALFFCAQKMIGLRFLDFRNHVQAKEKLNFIDDFKIVLQRLSQLSTIEELDHVCQVFCKDALDVPLTKTRLYIRKISNNKTEPQGTTSPLHTQSHAEIFLEAHAHILLPALKASPIMIYDEIDFTHFYNNENAFAIMLQFLDTINADIFLPIFEQQNLVAYIIIDRHSRLNNLYTNLERDQMIVFASYLGAIIYLLNNKSLEILIERQQELKRELYARHKEIEQHKESMRSFLHANTQQIGVICYQNRRFIINNAAARELIPINLNNNEGHPITQTIKQLATAVESYRTPQVSYIKDKEGNTLVLSALPHLEKNMVIITVSYPNIADIIKQQIDTLRDSSEWDSLLYLETTKSGHLINQLIPGTGPTLLQFKIDLLKASMNSKAVLLDSTDDDLMPLVELLHHISLRDQLHTITLEKPCTDSSIAIKLFGINPLFNDGKKEQQSSIMEQLSSGGTLFIKNIHYLDLETQNYLAEFVKCGVFRMYKSDHKCASNAHIICSSDQNLAQRVQQGTFSRPLYEALYQTQLIMPSLITLPEKELFALAEGFSEQAMHYDTFEDILALSDKEKQRLTRSRPTSLITLKQRVQQLLIHKSKKHHVYEETAFNPAYEVSDPDLTQAKCLGRHALKDRRIMGLLWNKLKNQSDIAKFLNVDRSSVWRRCKEYGLEDQ